MSASDWRYRVLWAMNWYDSGPEVHHEAFDTLDEVYKFLAEVGLESWHVRVVQGRAIELDDEHLKQMRSITPDSPQREERERETYDRLRKKFG